MTTRGSTTTDHTVLIVGAGEVATALQAIAQTLGWAPIAAESLEETMAALPRAETVVVLSHHDDVDGPALSAALGHGRSYVGAMGSRKTQARRRAWMVENGTSAELADSVRGPAGLDIGANTPAEIALSIAAEIVAVRRAAAGGSLSGRPGPIHADLAPGTAECPAG